MYLVDVIELFLVDLVTTLIALPYSLGVFWLPLAGLFGLVYLFQYEVLHGPRESAFQSTLVVW